MERDPGTYSNLQMVHWRAMVCRLGEAKEGVSRIWGVCVDKMDDGTCFQDKTTKLHRSTQYDQMPRGALHMQQNWYCSQFYERVSVSPSISRSPPSPEKNIFHDLLNFRRMHNSKWSKLMYPIPTLSNTPNGPSSLCFYCDFPPTSQVSSISSENWGNNSQERHS